MADKGSTKLKMLYIKEYLEKKSDEDNPVSVEELIDFLQKKEIDCERKSVYSDVKTLKEYGMDISSVRSPSSARNSTAFARQHEHSVVS